MYHSLTFATSANDQETGTLVGVNTWTDWHLIPASRPTMTLPKPSTNLIEIPGRDGTYDMSSYLTGGVSFGDRTGSFDFYVDNDHEHWITIYRKIATYLHGKRLFMCLADDDPGYYYEGRFSLNSWKSEPTNSMVTIEYQVGPYKYAVRTHGANRTIWDPFNFETDDDWDSLSSLTVDGFQSYTLHGYDYPYKLTVGTPTIASGSNIVVGFNDVWHTFTQNGEQFMFPAPANPGNNTLLVTGNGVATFAFQDGSL